MSIIGDLSSLSKFLNILKTIHAQKFNDAQTRNKMNGGCLFNKQFNAHMFPRFLLKEGIFSHLQILVEESSMVLTLIDQTFKLSQLHRLLGLGQKKGPPCFSFLPPTFPPSKCGQQIKVSSEFSQVKVFAIADKMKQ